MLTDGYVTRPYFWNKNCHLRYRDSDCIVLVVNLKRARLRYGIRFYQNPSGSVTCDRDIPSDCIRTIYNFGDETIKYQEPLKKRTQDYALDSEKVTKEQMQQKQSAPPVSVDKISYNKISVPSNLSNG